MASTFLVIARSVRRVLLVIETWTGAPEALSSACSTSDGCGEVGLGSAVLGCRLFGDEASADIAERLVDGCGESRGFCADEGSSYDTALRLSARSSAAQISLF
jgi:hypothetical protein